jgi:hypothetical protein
MTSPIPTDDQGRSPFRVAAESKDIDAAITALAPDVTFRSPAVFAPYTGRDTVGEVLRVVGRVLLPNLAYEWQLREGDREALGFNSLIGDRAVEGIDVLRYDEAGQVVELVVMIRPLSALIALRDGVRAELERGAAVEPR